MNRAILGDIIEWTIPYRDHNVAFVGTHRAEVSLVDEEEGHYGVYADYGMDLIPFEDATLIPKTFV